MLLIGMFDSPFVRRVAITMKLLGIPFEHGNWSVGKDFERIRSYNPLARVPALVLDSDEVLFESSAILDFLDEQAGSRVLLPRHGEPRRDGLRLMAMATGAAEKGVSVVYESAFRPPEKRHQPWLDRCRTQINSSLAELERVCVSREVARSEGHWLMGDTMTQPDITLVCVFTFLTDAAGVNAADFPTITKLCERCEALQVFKDTRLAFFTPKQS